MLTGLIYRIHGFVLAVGLASCHTLAPWVAMQPYGVSPRPHVHGQVELIVCFDSPEEARRAVSLCILKVTSYDGKISKNFVVRLDAYSTTERHVLLAGEDIRQLGVSDTSNQAELEKLEFFLQIPFFT